MRCSHLNLDLINSKNAKSSSSSAEHVFRKIGAGMGPGPSLWALTQCLARSLQAPYPKKPGHGFQDYRKPASLSWNMWISFVKPVRKPGFCQTPKHPKQSPSPWPIIPWGSKPEKYGAQFQFQAKYMVVDRFQWNSDFLKLIESDSSVIVRLS